MLSLTGERAPGRSGQNIWKGNTVSASHLDMSTGYPYAFTDDNYQLGEDATDSIKPSRKDPVAEIPRHEELGWPLIPRQSDKTLQESKSVLRAYVTATYRKPPLCLPFYIYKIIMFQVTILITRWQWCHGQPCRQMSTLNMSLPSLSRTGNFCWIPQNFSSTKFSKFGGTGLKDKMLILRDLSFKRPWTEMSEM
jgi:hypothetical protein